MTPCEKLGYKVGDRFEVVGEKKKGEIFVLAEDDDSVEPRFLDKKGTSWWARLEGEVGEIDIIVRPLKPQTEAEKRGAKFGTMGVVKATGDRVVFIREDEMKLGHYWVCLIEGKYFTDAFQPSTIRLDHEPEYKEIPFSEATDEQRMDVRNLVHRNGHTITQIFKFDNGTWVYALSGYDWTGTNTDLITVRVPA